MSYVSPTTTVFKARYPEFSVVSDELVTLVLNESIDVVGDTWLEKDRAKAQMLLTAHTLSMEGEPARSKAISNGSNVASVQSGEVTSMKVGDVSVTYSGRSQSSSGNNLGEITKEYLKTPYGTRYLELMKRSFFPIMVV